MDKVKVLEFLRSLPSNELKEILSELVPGLVGSPPEMASAYGCPATIEPPTRVVIQDYTDRLATLRVLRLEYHDMPLQEVVRLLGTPPVTLPKEFQFRQDAVDLVSRLQSVGCRALLID